MLLKEEASNFLKKVNKKRFLVGDEILNQGLLTGR